MATDTVTPLATAAQFLEGAFADLARSYSGAALADIMIQATRACETECGRRLAPFTVTESHRAEGIDPDEYSDAENLPLDLQGSLGRSYAYALGASSLVRHVWLNEFAPHYQEYWSYSNVQVLLIRSYGGSQAVAPTQILGGGPEPDTGHLWFTLGLFLPVGSLVKVTYSGGYQTTPADLVRASTYMAAAIIARELDPLAQQHGHSPDALEAKAVTWLTPYLRSQ